MTLLAYVPAIQGGFIWDDDDYVINNETLRSFSGLLSIWTDPSATPQYYPLVHSTFWIEYQLWGLWSSGYHVTNVMLHILGAILLWRLLRDLSVPLAFVIALVFALHPVHVESVAWITERKNVLSGVFYLAAMTVFLRGYKIAGNGIAGQQDSDPIDGTAKLGRWYVAATALFLCALLSKTVSSTLPAAILVILWWKRGTLLKRDLWATLPLFAMGMGFGLVTVWLEKFQVGADGIDWELSFVQRCLIAGRAIVFYATKLVSPVQLTFIYPRWEIDASSPFAYAFPAMVLLLIVVLWVLRDRLGRGPLAAVLLFCGTLFPALGFFDVYPMRFSFVADHFQYLASIAWISLVVVTMNAVLRSISSASMVLPKCILGVSIATLVFLTWQQGKVYEGLEVLWRDTLAKNPNTFLAHNNLGRLLIDRGDYEEAEKHLRESVRIKPDFGDSLVNLAKSREAQGDLTEAGVLYQKATEVAPGYPQAWNGRGVVAAMSGDLEPAMKHLQRALEIKPDYANALVNLGLVHAQSGRTPDAIRALESALQLDPHLLEAKTNLARMLMANEDTGRAEQLLKEVLSANPNDISTLLNLGVITGSDQRYETAIEYFRRIVEIDRSNAQAHYNLGAMYDAIGNQQQSHFHFNVYARLTGQTP
ncbi:MAG: tetratricopeptide repeat protein [Planctomycetota bacterium]